MRGSPVTLRAKLTLAFALFSALPMLVALVPLARALSSALEAEYRTRLDGAARAVEGELRRIGTSAADAAREVARGPEVDALARDRAQGLLDPAEAAARAAEWMEARGLDVLAVADDRGAVVSSGHLPGRAGDVDPELRALFASSGPGRAVPRLVTRSTAAGLEPLLALVAWEPVPAAGEGAPLRVAAGIALGSRLAARLAELTGGDVVVSAVGAERPFAASPRAPAAACGGSRRGSSGRPRPASVPCRCLRGRRSRTSR